MSSSAETQWANVSRKRLMENITLLWSIKEIVETPKENVLVDNEDSSRQLSLEREKTVVDFLAFLSGTHDDNCKVTAVCIEESDDHQSLTIRIAANTGDCCYLRDGFEDLAMILERAHSRGKVLSKEERR
jgi:hypothetical protein